MVFTDIARIQSLFKGVTAYIDSAAQMSWILFQKKLSGDDAMLGNWVEVKHGLAET
jgi:hypothetical protein